MKQVEILAFYIVLEKRIKTMVNIILNGKHIGQASSDNARIIISKTRLNIISQTENVICLSHLV
jgi:hypothetical protein